MNADFQMVSAHVFRVVLSFVSLVFTWCTVRKENQLVPQSVHTKLQIKERCKKGLHNDRSSQDPNTDRTAVLNLAPLTPLKNTST